jgi:hypothetical protein
MIWTWFAFALALGASAWGLRSMLNPGLAGYTFFTLPILIAALPLVWRQRTRAAVVSAIFLAMYSLNPLVFGAQIIYLPACVVMFIGAWRISGQKLFSMRVG